MSERATALAALLEALRVRDYAFVTPTPATHARVLARPDKQLARDLRDVFGWSLPFTPEVIGEPILRLLHDADMLEQRGDHLRSLVRVSSLGADLFLHSAFPTTRSDAVFFGPDSYRFVRFLEEVLALLPRQGHLVDIGTGAGVGALAAASLLPDARITMTDINPAALELAAINWAHSRLPTPHIVRGDALAAVTDEIDIVIANPPYIADAAHRAYRDGGGMHGAALSVRWADDAARRLPSGGALALYTGSAIIGGEDPLREALIDVLGDFDVRYEEIDPDVFGEELEREDYADVERIAVVGVVAIKR